MAIADQCQCFSGNETGFISPHIFVMFKIDPKNADQLEMLYW
jgi:hypothetical protein